MGPGGESSTGFASGQTFSYRVHYEVDVTSLHLFVHYTREKKIRNPYMSFNLKLLRPFRPDLHLFTTGQSAVRLTSLDDARKVGIRMNTVCGQNGTFGTVR